MKLILFYLRKLFAVIKNEVLVLPSRVAVVLFFLFILLLPLLTDDIYILRIFTMACIFAIFAASWDLLSGFTGQINFGHALFFGVGAYGAALFNLHFNVPPWASIPLGALVAVGAGLIVGIPALRLKGTYLTLTTLAFPIILLGVVISVPGFTGGELGLSGVTRLAETRVQEYYVIAVVMLGLCTIMWKITDSNVGIIFHAIREDQIAVRASGVNTTLYKLLAFSLSGFFGGISGGLYAHFMNLADPSTLSVNMSFLVVIWSIFGGAATIYGPVGAVFLLVPFVEFTHVLKDYRLIVFAVLVLLVLLFMPDGLFRWLREKIEEECPRCKVRNVAWRKTCRVCTAPMH
ncbi:MAG TPA: branched-chain amino acid ABC transporter permease [Deltaproteobacteria bacterium]|nr:branched-chain amino acid ABC transporter permease [Deltaproteobacteria bacterium]